MGEIKMKTYLLKMKTGKEQRITIPEDWKLTFGPLLPGQNSINQRPALRIYETKEKQRACFNDVEWFRDEDIKVEEKITRTQGKKVCQAGPDGNRDVVVEARFTEWVDPDDPVEPKKEFLELPGITFSEEDNE